MAYAPSSQNSIWDGHWRSDWGIINEKHVVLADGTKICAMMVRKPLRDLMCLAGSAM